MNQNNPLSAYQCSDLPGYELLAELALNLMWSWNHSTDKIWEKLDPKLWEITRNPWVVLQTASRDKLQKMLADKKFSGFLQDIVKTQREYAALPTWFEKNHPKSPLKCVAYFSMEYMLSEALPIYSGGLGNVAGDQLKAASDLGVPVVAVGLLYQQGYFRQIIDKDGAQKALYPFNDPGQLPITPLRKPNGEWLRLEVQLPGWSMWVRTWQVQVGRVKLYLLDSNDPANYPVHRGITSELYGGDSELRLKQELILGISGWRLLQELGIKPDVCHLNEGHAAFAVLERAYSFMKETGQPFDVALSATRVGTLFTTHTAVPAGFDRFSPVLIEQYLSKYAQERLNISLHDLLALGRQNPHDTNEPFNMAYLAIRGSGAINAVSKLHAKVSRKIFQSLFPNHPEDEVPVGYVTNGVHMPSWDSAESDKLWEDACGNSRWFGTTENMEKEICCVSETKLWEMRTLSRSKLVNYTRDRLYRQLGASGVPIDQLEQIKYVFNPHTLTLGFARRFATYKRPNMLLHDPQRLLRILTNAECPVQLIIAGKAHPADQPGQALIKEWIHFTRNNPAARAHVVFLGDYDMDLTEHLVQGVDVWINTPRRPWEACGTSGMKVLVNGGLNLSELDGWWAEAYTPEVGWAIGDGQEHDSDPVWDAKEANALYELLEREVIPEFYTRDANGIPTAWVNRIRQSMSRLTPQYSANRSVREYTEKHYLPAAEAYTKRASDKGIKGAEILKWKQQLDEKWAGLHFLDVKVETKGDKHEFEAQLFLNGLNPDAIKVELYAEGYNGSGGIHQEMQRIPHQALNGATLNFEGSVPADRSASDFTPRVIPQYDGAEVPLEAPEILWQK